MRQKRANVVAEDMSMNQPGSLQVSINHINPLLEDEARENETIRSRIERIQEDLINLKNYYNIDISETRTKRLERYYNEELASLQVLPFESYSQDDKVDYLLLQAFLKRELQRLKLDVTKDEKTMVLLPFASRVIQLCEERQQKVRIRPQMAAQEVHEVGKLLVDIKQRVEEGKIKIGKTTAYRSAKTVDQLRTRLQEWFDFYNEYEPMFTWWVTEPYQKVMRELEGYADVIRTKLVHIAEGDKGDAIVGDPIGLDGLLSDLEAEMIPYTPKELISIGETEYQWCEVEMKKAAKQLGYESWRDALEYVKDLYVPPGEFINTVRDLANEATDFVKEHDLVTVPEIAEETWRMFMMSPEKQKLNPYFTGGDSIRISYPTSSMGHAEKVMSMRGNNVHFARSTVFHEMIPGHHLQIYMNARHRSYRQLFRTPFSAEGWALYWEMILWDDERFVKTPENKIGMLFWRMHRCARIIFSLKFHLGLMTAEECVDFLVDKVGHDRYTAEGEVRRSFVGSYTPLYQAGYMIGALQLYSLRKEVLERGNITPKQFHYSFLRVGPIPNELFRGLIEKTTLSRDYQARWRFYHGHLNDEGLGL